MSEDATRRAEREEREARWRREAEERDRVRARTPHYAVCKLGPARFFWVAWAPGVNPYGSSGLGPEETLDQKLGLEATATGYAADRETAVARAVEAAGPGDYPAGDMRPGWASGYHRRLLLKERAGHRAERQGAAGVELLWTAEWTDPWYSRDELLKPAEVQATGWRVVRRSATRVYVDRAWYRPERQRSGDVWAYDVRTFVLDRAHLERDGWATRGNREWGERFYVRREDAIAAVQRQRLYTPGGASVPECFRALSIVPPCTREDVKRAYRKLARAAHPDRGGTHEAFLALQGAYEQALRLTQGAPG